MANGAPPPAAEAAAVARARSISGSLEQRIIARAESLLGDRRMQNEISRLWRLLRVLSLLIIIAAALAGAATARTVLASAAAASSDGITVNFFWALASLLALHLLAYLVWLVMILALPSATQGGLLGGLLLWAWRQMAARVTTTRKRSAATAAILGLWGQGRTGRWLLSCLSHAVWTGYLLGALLMTVALLSAQRFNFVWETTILDTGAYTALTAAIASLPAALGLAIPDAAAVQAAQWPGPIATGNETLWSTLLVASLLLYGIAPRLLTAILCFALARRSAHTKSLDINQAGYARLLPLLAPTVTATHILDPDDTTRPATAAVPDLHDRPNPPGPGPVYVLGWEIDAPQSGWPPAPNPVHDLGLCDSREDLAQATATLKQSQDSPSRLVVVVDLRHSPDRGVTAALQALQAASGGRVYLLLSGAAALHARTSASDAGDRVADWVGAAERAGISSGQMIAIDLNAPSPEDTTNLAHLFGPAA